MFEGSLTYGAYRYNVHGFDNVGSCRLVISSMSYNAVEFLGKKELWERHVDIKSGSVSIEGSKDEDLNMDFFCRLGALISYMKTACIRTNEEGYTGLNYASNEFVPKPDRWYNIPNVGRVKLSYGVVCEVHVSTPFFTLDLAPTNTEFLIPTLKNGVRSGFHFDKEYLGFESNLTENLVQSISEGVTYLADGTKIKTVNGMFTCIEDIIKAHPNKEFNWLLHKDYRIVTDDTLEDVCNYIMSWKGYVYYDTETSGLELNFYSRIGQADQVVGIILSVKYGESFFFPMQMKAIPNLCGGDHKYFMERYMRPILEGKDIVAHNAPFDWKAAYIYDINTNIVHDTMIIIKLTLGTVNTQYPLSLKANASTLLGRDSLELSDLVVDDSWGESDVRFWDLPYELVRLYACADTDNTAGLLEYAEQTDLLNKYGASKVYEIELAFGLAVAYQEFYGHRLDVNHIDTIRDEVKRGIADLKAKMVDIAGRDFNPNSPRDLLQIMYHDLGIPEQINRKTGKPSTDKFALKYLASLETLEGETMYPFAKYLKEYRELEGIRKTVDKFPEYLTDDGYIFSEVKQFGADTGRVSITKPNYQSYNDVIKKNVIPREGYWMFDTDYSSVEYRVLGSMVGNQSIIENFRDPDFDYHAYQASHMYRVPYAQVTAPLRKAAKSINFGLPYGMGDESLGATVFGEATPENTRKAGALRNAYFKGQEDIRDWFEYHRNRGVTEGYTETYFGRRRYYPKAENSVGSIKRKAGNFVIQGCVDGNTRIQTKEFGIVRIKDVEGLNVLVWDGIKWSNGDVLYSGKKPKCVVSFSGGQKFICSPQHKFLVVDNHSRERWVEAKDLKFGYKSTANNSHVKVNTVYTPSYCGYSSKDAYKYMTNNHESNNALLEDVQISFDRGVLLGRLASDGSYNVRTDGGSCITQFVAEHEYNILPELRTCMESLGYTENESKLREGRNEKLKKLSVYSSSLAHEISDLDIKHKIHDNIFMDTEMLRGFISGFFDGDGGISGKAITLVFGVQYDFEPMCLDLQKALLFFGIRSRYHKYDDRHVIQIKTNDNQKFLDLIGFLNQDKQDRGRSLECKTEETTFGRCLVVESVEVTDELIDMYDVCNTEGGYYVADGIITHNTAADIYKTAVGRAFKRICREGWLGKVLFVGFIHDELLGEVSNEIDPMKFLKVLREEFEVKVDGWCPLYMGFGFGTSWYEAKKVELPIKLQWEFVEKYGETGYPDWDGNARKFCDNIPNLIREYRIRDTKNQLLAPESQGKEIKPALNKELIDLVKEDSEIYSEVVSSWEQNDFQEVHEVGEASYLNTYYNGIVKNLEEQYISDLYSVDGVYQPMSPISSDTQEAIDIFCKLHKIDRSLINIESIEEQETSGLLVDDSDYDYGFDEELDTEEKIQRMIDSRVDTLGMYLDTDNKMVICLLCDAQYMNFIQSHVNRDGDGYKIRFKDNQKNMLYDTQAWLSSENIPIIQQMYIQYMKSLGK